MRDTLLIVDDLEINRVVLENILHEDYRIITAEDGIYAMEQVEKNKDRILGILSDLVMPNMDGLEFLNALNEKHYLSVFPVMVITSDESVISEKECYDAGVSEFLHKPFDPDLVRTRVNNVVNLYLYKQHLEDTVAEQTSLIKKRNTGIIELLGNIVENKSLESNDHIRRIKGYTRILAERLAEKYPRYALNKDMVDIIVEASALHDMGKITIPESILLKPGRLTIEEFRIMKNHTVAGSDFIKNAKDIWDDEYGKVSYEICRYHHERFDGKGYPEGLKGDNIPISAQIVSIADVYDALVKKTVYKTAFAKEKAFDMILKGECGEFNPDILDCFTDKINEFEELAEI